VKQVLAFVMLLSMLVPAISGAHELHQKISRGSAVVIELAYPDHSPFSYEQFEVFREGEEAPYQTGRSDALGRIVFVPDRDGAWRIRAFSEDGHGIDITIEAGPEGSAASAEAPGDDRSVRIILGLIIIVAVFMVVLLIVRRRGR
jgi:nickel transport protein